MYSVDDEKLSIERFREKITNLLNVCYSSANFKTKQDFAEKLGTNYLQLYRWMEGKTVPRKEALKNICEVCHVDFLTFMSLEDYEQSPHKKLTIACLNKAYEKSENQGTRSDSEILIVLSAGLVYNLLSHLDITLTMQSAGSEGDILPTTRGQINFNDSRLLDLHIVVYGGTDNIYIRCFSDVSAQDIHTTKLTLEDVNRLGLLITENYLKQNKHGREHTN